MSLISAITGHSATPQATAAKSSSTPAAAATASGTSDDLDDVVEISSDARNRLAQQTM